MRTLLTPRNSNKPITNDIELRDLKVDIRKNPEMIKCNILFIGFSDPA